MSEDRPAPPRPLMEWISKADIPSALDYSIFFGLMLSLLVGGVFIGFCWGRYVYVC